MTTYAINRSDATLPVEIEYPGIGGGKEFVFLQPKSKAIVPAGSRVTLEFAAVNAKLLTLKTIDGLGEPVLPE